MAALIVQKSVYYGNATTIVFSIIGDLTARKLTFTAKKDTESASPVLLQKLNTIAGGSDSEIVASTWGTPDHTIIVITLNSEDTKQSYGRLSWSLDSEDASDPNDVDTVAIGVILIIQTIGGVPVGGSFVKDSLSLTKYAHWKMVAGVITVKAMAGWSTNPTAALVGNTLTLTSAESEFPAGADFRSTNQDFFTGTLSAGTWTTASRVINYDDVTGTIEFWIQYYE